MERSLPPSSTAQRSRLSTPGARGLAARPQPSDLHHNPQKGCLNSLQHWTNQSGWDNYGKIYLVIIVAISLATSGGAVLFGRIRDLSGDFAPAWPLVMALCAVSVVLLLALGRDRSAGYDA